MNALNPGIVTSIGGSMVDVRLESQMPSCLGYLPTLGTELSKLEERFANTKSGAITSIQAVYMPADDLTNPGAVHTFSHLAASIVLSRKRASEGLKDIIAMLGLEQLSSEDRKIVNRARRLERFLTQPFFTTEQFSSSIKGKSVSLKDALDGCERILNDEFAEYPENALYMTGTINEAKQRANEQNVKKNLLTRIILKITI